MILLDAKKTTQFIVDVANAHDKECLTDVTKVPIIHKATLMESELEAVQNLTWVSMVWNNSIIDILCRYITQISLHMHTNKFKRLYKQQLPL